MSGNRLRGFCENVIIGGSSSNNGRPLMRSFCRILASCLVLVACGDDDGGTNDNNDNQNNTNQPVCGNGAVETGEECDDGAGNSDTAPNACRTGCREAYCGDGVTDAGEDCDDGDDGTNQADACPNTCLAPVCGDGHLWVGHEVCDDGNTADGDDCRGDCGQDLSDCGNGSPDPGEACDDGAQNSDEIPNACRKNCQTPTCGDGVHDDEAPYNEACDNGAANSDVTPDACRTDCTLPSCGDDVADSDDSCDGTDLGGRTCQDYGYVDPAGLVCLAGCDGWDEAGCAAICGNGVAEPGEACDGSELFGVTCDASGYAGGGTPSCVSCGTIVLSTCCQDADGDGRGTSCDQGLDECEDDENNWTATGCASCVDVDGDGLGVDCDLGEDCDDDATGIVVPCQVNGCPEGWAYIPAGDFEMGCDSGDACWDGQTNESPRHTVTLTAYCLEKTEVSVGAYRACVDAGVCTGTPTDTGGWYNWSVAVGSREEHPINGINWSESREYCQSWLGGDLPTEAQWEKGARGGPGDTRKYPWGAIPEPDCTRCNFDVNGGTSGVGCSSVTVGPGTWEAGHLTGPGGNSPYGLKDMAGNVWEWVQDWYAADFYDNCPIGCTDPLNTSSAGYRVIRGGSFYGSAASLRVVRRRSDGPSNRGNLIGFRCGRTP